MATFLENASRNLLREEGTKLSNQKDEAGNPFHLTYLDTNGYLTAGHGHKLTPDDEEFGYGEGQLVSGERASEWYSQDLQNAVSDARYRVNNFDYLSDDKKSIVTQMAYQMGGSGLGAFTNFLDELNKPNPSSGLLRQHMLDSKWAREDSPARAQRLADSLLDKEESPLEADFFTAAEEDQDRGFRRQDIAARFGKMQLAQYAPSSLASEVAWYENRANQFYSRTVAFPDERELSAESEYLYSGKIAEILGDQPGFVGLTSEDFIPGKFGVDRTISPEENYKKNVLPDLGSFAFTYHPEGEDKSYISSLMDGPTPGMLYLPGGFSPIGSAGIKAADIKNYGDLSPAIRKYQQEREAFYNADGKSFTDSVRSYLDASVFAVANAANQAMKFSDYWASALPLAIIGGWDYLTTSDEEGMEELLDKNPGLDNYLEKERKALKPGASEEEKESASIRAMQAYQAHIGSDENQAKLVRVYQKLADTWNIPFDKVPDLLGQMALGKSPFIDRMMASAQVRLAAIEDEDYGAKRYYIIPSRLGVSETRPKDVYSFPTTRYEVGLDLSIAAVTGGLSRVGWTIPSILFNKFLGPKATRAARVYTVQASKRIQLEGVKKQLAALGATHTLASRARSFISKKVASGKSKVGIVDPNTGVLKEGFIGPLTENASRIKDLTAQADALSSRLARGDAAISKLINRGTVPTVSQYAKKGMKAFFPDAPFWMRIADEVAFTTAANSMLNNFVFDSSTGLKLASEQDLAEATPLGRFLMAMTPLVGGIAVGSFKSLASLDPTAIKAAKINTKISKELLDTGERQEVKAAASSLVKEDEAILREIGVENPFREIAGDPNTEYIPTAKAQLFYQLVYPPKKFNPNDFKWAWANLREMLLSPGRRAEIAQVIESGRKYGVDEEFLKWFEGGIDDVYKLWDDDLVKNEGKQARKFLDGDLNEKDFGWLEETHRAATQIDEAGRGVDTTAGRELGDQKSYVLHRDGRYVAVARSRPDGKLDVEILQSDQMLRGKDKVKVDSIYKRAAQNIENLFLKRNLFLPVQRLRALSALSDQTEAYLRTTSELPEPDLLQAFKQIKENNFAKIVEEHSESTVLKNNNKNLWEYFKNNVDGFHEPLSRFQSKESQEILGQYLRTRLDLGKNKFFQAGTEKLPVKAVDELNKILTRASQRLANVAAAPIIEKSPLSAGSYDLVDLIIGVDPNNLVSIRKGKPVKVDPVTYFRELVKKNRRKYKVAPVNKLERVIKGETVAKTTAMKSVVKNGKAVWEPRVIDADPSAPTIKAGSPEADTVIRENPDLHSIELDSPDLPNQLYVVTLDGLGPGHRESYFQPGTTRTAGKARSYQVVFTSDKDAFVAAWDIRSLVTIAKAKTTSDAVLAFRDMLELQKSLNLVPPGAVQRAYDNHMYAMLGKAESVDDVFDLYRDVWIGGSLGGEASIRQRLGGPRSVFTTEYMHQELTRHRLRNFNEKNITSFGVDRRSINKETFLAKKTGTNQVRVYSRIARNDEPLDHLVYKDLAGAGYPLGKQISTDARLRMQYKQYMDDLAERAISDPIEGAWLGSFRAPLSKTVKDAVGAAKKSERRAATVAARQAGDDDSAPPTGIDPALIVRGSGIHKASTAAMDMVDSDDLFSLSVRAAADSHAGYKFLVDLFGKAASKTAIDTVQRLKDLGKGKTIAQRGLLEAASRLESAHRMLGVEGEFSKVDFDKSLKGELKERVLKWVPGTDYTRKTVESRKTSNVFFRAWGLNDRIKALVSRIREDFTTPEDWNELQRLRDDRVSFVSRVMPWAAQGLDFIKYEFDRIQSFNGSEFFSGTAANKHRDALMSRVERFTTLTPEEQSQKIFMSSDPEDYVTLKDVKLLLDVVDQNILAPRRYRHERLNPNFDEAWLQNYYPRIWNIKKSVDRWRKEGRELSELSKPGERDLPPGMDVDQRIFSNEWKKIVDEKVKLRIKEYIKEQDAPGAKSRGTKNFVKNRSAIEWKIKHEVYRKDYFDELLQRGFVPETWNPIEMATLKANEMDNYVMGVRIIDELVNNNLIHALNYDELLDLTRSYRQLAREKFTQGKGENQFHLNFVDVTANLQQIAPGMFTSRQRKATDAAHRAIKDQGVLKEIYGTEARGPEPLPTENVWIDPLKDKSTGQPLGEGFWAKVNPQGELQDLPAELPSYLGDKRVLGKVMKPVPAKMFFADPYVAKIIQNVSSHGAPQILAENIGAPAAALWDKWRRTNNFLNGVNLAWSWFHASSVGLFENIMNDLTRLSRAATMVSDLKRAEKITTFAGKDGIDKEINKQWFVRNAAIRSLIPGLSILIQAGQFPARSRLPTLALPNLRTGKSIPTELLPSNIPGYKSRTGLKLRERYEKRFTQKHGDSGEIVGKSFVQVMDEFATKLKGREWEPFQETFVPQLLRRDHPDYAKYNVGSFGRQIDSLVQGTTPTDLLNPIFEDILNAGIEANFLNPIAARAGQKEWFYSFNRTFIDAFEYFQGKAPIQEYPMGGPGTAKALAARGTTALSMPLRYLGAAASEGQKWLFESIIPRAKYSAWVENMQQEIFRRPEIANNPFLLKNAAADIAASIDNRFGMLNYDNLMMDRAMKDLMFLYWRAPAWKLGTKREILGGIRDTAYSVSLKLQNKLERAAGVPKDIRRRNVAEIKLNNEERLELSHRASYLLGMFGLGAYAAFFQFARTGQFPEFDWNTDQSAWNNFHDNMEKLWFPLSGDVELGPYGMEPIRLSMPTYNKDVLNWFRNYGMGFIETFPHTLPPAWGPIKLLYTGADYRKNSIYSADSDTFPEKAADFFVASVAGQVPFNFQQVYDRLTIDQAPIAKVAVESFLGLTKAGSGFIRSPAFVKAMDLMVADLPQTNKPRYLSIYQEAQRKIAGRLQNGERLDRRKIARLFEKDLRDNGLVSSPEILINLTERTDATRLSMIDPVLASRKMFENMLKKARGYDQIHEVVKLMSPEEFTAYFGETERSRRLRKVNIAMRGFAGEKGSVESSLANLNETIDRKAVNNYVVPGLIGLNKKDVDTIKSANISNKWKISLIASLRFRDGR